MKIPRPRLNLIELGLMAVLVAVIGFLAGQYQNQMRVLPFIDGGSDLRALEQRYGPARNSRFGEEWIVRDFFKDKRGGVFVDVGANHYQRESNTYYLDVELGWSGIAIEPQTKFAADYKTYRPRTTFVPLFVSDSSNREAVLQVPRNNDLIASADAGFVRSSGGVEIEAVRANTTTLDDVLQRSGIETIDFLSMDIELHEPIALKGFSIDRYRPRLVAVEAHMPVRQQILDYFARHGYVVAGNYLRADSANLWFIPLSTDAK